MSLIDFILNIVGLLLWLNWRAAYLPAQRPAGAPLLSNIKPIGPPRPAYHQWIGLPVLLVARALFYWEVGPAARWNPILPLGPTALVFRSDLLGRMLLYSLLGFAASLSICYLWLLFLSVVNGRSDNNGIHRLVRAGLGRMERWPWPIKLATPLIIAALAWLALHPVAVWLNLVPASNARLVVLQGGLIGVAGLLTLKYLISGILLLYVINSYVYMGEFALWPFVNETARNLLEPWRWLPLRIGKIDLTPILYLAVVWVGAELVGREVNLLFRQTA